MPHPSRTLLVALLCAVIGLPLASCTSDPEPEDSAVLSGNAQEKPRRTDQEDKSTKPGQTSEGITGPTAAPLPDGVQPRPRISKEKGWRLAPGITYRRWDQTDRRGKVRAHLLRVDPDAPGVSLDRAARLYVPERGPLTGLLARDEAIAGVNGGFFDIYDTGAPLGVGVDRQRGFLHASLHTWNNAFYLTPDGTPRIGVRRVAAQIDQFPQMEITNVNSPRVRHASIGIYNPAWGRTSGYSITDGQRRNVRMVVIQDDRVVANKTSLNAGKQIQGAVLVGRGPGAVELAQLRVGSLASVRWNLEGDPAVAISGEKILLRDGKRQVENDSELHPRTAVGIDRDTGKILLLTIDGRQSSSRGYTLVELAAMLKSLGAEDALNLDGGGSTTMVGAGKDGLVRVLNSPSDGSLRHIPDGLAVIYEEPQG
ncbi:MAG: phosphodiester glycosidase family protein [Nocardioides sp.]